MGYTKLTTTEDVFAYFKTTFTEDTNPTVTQIEQWIDEGTAIIYSVLATVYTVPVTDDNDLNVFKALCNEYVRAEVQFTRRGTNNTIKGRLTVPKGVDHEQFYRKLNMFATGKMLLTGATAKAVESNSYNVENSVEFVADKDEQQW